MTDRMNTARETSDDADSFFAEFNGEIPIWTPYGAYAAAEVMQAAIDAQAHLTSIPDANEPVP
jgi:hypothetical protein